MYIQHLAAFVFVGTSFAALENKDFIHLNPHLSYVKISSYVILQLYKWGAKATGIIHLLIVSRSNHKIKRFISHVSSSLPR
jgi:hypothetical protein